MTKGYLYSRLSTVEQRKGHGLERQQKGVTEYCNRHGITLQDVSFNDLGVSGFHGANADRGELAEFIDAVKLGVIDKGSVLIMEDLDRLTRMDPMKARRLLEDILLMDIDVVTLKDQQRYSKERLVKEPYLIFMIIAMTIRSNDESKVKSLRVRAAWGKKKIDARTTGKIVTKRIPTWLKVSEDRFEVIEDKASAVLKVFELAAHGHGQHSIAKMLNQEQVPTLKTGEMWGKGVVTKLLNSDSVRGTYVPHDVVTNENGKKTRLPLEPIEGYYPRIVSEELWQATRTHKAKGGGSVVLRNVLSGVGVCGRCGGTMVRIGKNQRDVYLVCSKARVGAGCRYEAVRYGDVELAVRRLNPMVDMDLTDDDALTSRRASIVTEIDALRDHIGEGLKSRGGREALAELDADLVRMEQELDAIDDEIEANAPALVRARMDRAVDALAAVPFDVVAANAALKGVVDRVEVLFDEGEVVAHWKTGGSTAGMFRWPKE